MKLYEFEAKKIFRRYGIDICEGEVANDPAGVRKIYEGIGGKLVVKAQVLVGGRGKAGGIKVVQSPEEAETAAEQILNMKIKGLPVKEVLIERAAEIEKEFYIGVTIDRTVKKVVAIACAEGGIDIEEVAAKTPEKIAKVTIDPVLGFCGFQAKELCYKAGFPGKAMGQIEKILLKIYRIMLEMDASLVEINPLVISNENRIIALDAKMDLDDNALFRHNEFSSKIREGVDHPLEIEARKRGLTYVKLDGNVGIIGNGAGLVMGTLDAVKAVGGKAANFLDIGGGAKAEVVKSALELLMLDLAVKVVFVNIYGGITKCDEVAKGLIQAISSIELKVPIVLRFKGTMAEEGIKIIADQGFITADDMREAAIQAVNVAEGQGA